MTRRATLLALLLGAALATPALAQTKARSDKEVVRFILDKNVFAPYKPKPKPRPKQKTQPKPKKKEVKEVREELMLTGVFFDNTANSYQAVVETRDGDKKLFLKGGDSCGLYKVKVILGDRLGLVHTKTKKELEIGLGETFEGDVTGKQEVFGGSSNSSSRGPSWRGRRDRPKTSAIPKVDLSKSKREEILRRLRERAKKSRKNKGKK